MSESKKRFFKLISLCPRIGYLWDEEKNEMNVSDLETAIHIMSHGEIFMVQFFASIWLGNNKIYGFDIVDAVSILNKNEIEIILNWIKDPFWP